MQLGQAQEQQQQPEGSQQEQSPALPPVVRVHIVEDQSKADSTEAEKREANTRDNRDLVAQEGMHFEAKRMANYAFAQTILTGIGALLVFGSLVLALQANKAAIEAVSVTRKIGYGELRPYVSLARTERVVDPTGWHFQPVWRNYGQTPCRNVKCMMGWGFLDSEPNGEFAYADNLTEPVSLPLGPQDERPINGPHLKNEEIDNWGLMAGNFYFWGWIEYSDAIEPTNRHRSEFCCKLILDRKRDRWSVLTIGPHNGSDEDCLKQPHT